MTLTNQDLSIKLQKAKQCLVNKLDDYWPYQELIDQIDHLSRLLQSDQNESDFAAPKVTKPQDRRLLGRKNSQQLPNKSLESEFLPNQQLHNQIVAIIDRYFEQAISLSKRQIKYHQEVSLLKQDLDSLRAIANQLPQRYQRSMQEHFKICKQHIHQNKIALTNPFIDKTLITKVQRQLQTASISNYQEDHNNYLSLVLASNQQVHDYLFSTCEQSFTQWFQQEWQLIDSHYNNGGWQQIKQSLQQDISSLANLCQEPTLKESAIQSPFQIKKHVCSQTLKSLSRINFDYKYRQSSWLRILLAIVIGGIIFLFTQKLFGFILLLVQIINLLTGQDTKTIRFRQHSKELRRMLEMRSQQLVRFLADRVEQDLLFAFEKMTQTNQTQIEQIAEESKQNLSRIKQELTQSKNELNQLQKTQIQLQKIFPELKTATIVVSNQKNLDIPDSGNTHSAKKKPGMILE